VIILAKQGQPWRWWGKKADGGGLALEKNEK